MALTSSTFQVTFMGQVAGNAIWNVRYYQALSAEPDLVEMGGALVTEFQDELLPLLSEDYTFVGVRVQKVYQTAGPPVEVLSGQVGGVADDVLPNQAALVSTVYTLSAGRAWRGRIYTGGLPKSSLVDGLFTAAQAFNVAAAWNDLVTVTGIADLGMVHISKQGSPDTPANWTAAAIQSILGRRVPATIRRRRIGVGI